MALSTCTSEQNALLLQFQQGSLLPDCSDSNEIKGNHKSAIPSLVPYNISWFQVTDSTYTGKGITKRYRHQKAGMIRIHIIVCPPNQQEVEYEKWLPV